MSGVIIVTGGTHGIGRACVERLAADGKRVLCVGRDESAGIMLAGTSAKIIFQRADVRAPHQCRAIVDRALDVGEGRIAGLVNNAGMTLRRSFDKVSSEEWDEIFSTNTRSAFLLIQSALDGLIAAKGSVVNVSSIAGMVGAEGLAVYCATKAALIGLTQALALEYGRHVRFNAVCPGQIATRMMDSTLQNEALTAALIGTIPAARIAEGREVADVVRWLLSEESSFVNGAVIPIDGGQIAGVRALRP
jgi:meso-butanediol dehydrogenase / (S,S)-butanediol dehydrogenase / diacetyl reductase